MKKIIITLLVAAILMTNFTVSVLADGFEDSPLPSPTLPAAPSLPEIPSVGTMPALPSLDLPSLTLPELDKSLLELPDEFQEPIFKLPEMPELVIPKVNMAFDDLMQDLINNGYGSKGSLVLPEATPPARYGSKVIEDLKAKYETLWSAETVDSMKIPDTAEMRNFMNAQTAALQQQYADTLQTDAYRSILNKINTSTIWEQAQKPLSSDYFGALPEYASAAELNANYLSSKGWAAEFTDLDAKLNTILTDKRISDTTAEKGNKQQYKILRDQILSGMGGMSAADIAASSGSSPLSKEKFDDYAKIIEGE